MFATVIQLLTTGASSLTLPRTDMRNIDDWCRNRKFFLLQLSSLFLQVCCQHLKHTQYLSEFERMNVHKKKTQRQIVYLMNGQAQTAEHHLRLFLQRRDHIGKRLTHTSVSGQVCVVHQHAALPLDLILNTQRTLQTKTNNYYRKLTTSR